MYGYDIPVTKKGRAHGIIAAMRLDNFRLIHLHKNGDVEPLAHLITKRLTSQPHFYLDTCQRYLWLYRPNEMDNLRLDTQGFEVLSGIAAYNYLLRIACGLESKVIAETDIFGQFKTALQTHCLHQTQLSPSLSLYLTKIIEDAKRVRHEYLQGVGGSSYGSLARALLKPAPGESTLILGAGNICQAILPFFSHTSLYLWNRTEAKALTLAQELRQVDKRVEIEVVSSWQAVATQWQRARFIILCVPYERTLHDRLQQLHTTMLAQATTTSTDVPHKIILDLGSDQPRGRWVGADYLTLADIYAQKAARAEIQSTQVRSAMAACQDYAKLRSLALTQISAHCWEDLELFVS